MPFVASKEPLEDILNPDAVRKCGVRITNAVVDHMHDRTKHFTPVARIRDADAREMRPPGTAKESVMRSPVEATTRRGRMAWRATVFTEDPVFPYIEWNTKPHVIRAKAERGPNASLRFRGRSGAVIFRHEVRHPGTQGQHPFARGALQARGSVGRLAKGPLQQFGRDLVIGAPLPFGPVAPR